MAPSPVAVNTAMASASRSVSAIVSRSGRRHRERPLPLTAPQSRQRQDSINARNLLSGAARSRFLCLQSGRVSRRLQSAGAA